MEEEKKNGAPVGAPKNNDSQGGNHRNRRRRGGRRSGNRRPSDVAASKKEPQGTEEVTEVRPEAPKKEEAARPSGNSQNRHHRNRHRTEHNEKAGNPALTRTPMPSESEKVEPHEEIVVPAMTFPSDDEPMPMAPAKVKSEVTVEVIGIRFKATGKTYYFEPNGVHASRGDHAIVETARGLEYGEVTLGNATVSESDVVPPLRPVVRIATEADRRHHEENGKKEELAFKTCNERILAHKLDMKLIEAQYTFDNSKLLFYFTSAGRVDFRDLVKDLASVFRTRIELRQIGIRDEAKMIGGLGMCGRPLCCTKFLSDFGQVSIKMAKEQNLSLNSSKISGVCGRLMCCLRYESDTYAAELRRSPAVDALVRTPDGTGVVTEVNPLAGTVKVRFPENTPPPKTFSRDDVKVIGRAGKGGRPDEYIEGEQE